MFLKTKILTRNFQFILINLRIKYFVFESNFLVIKCNDTFRVIYISVRVFSVLFRDDDDDDNNNLNFPIYPYNAGTSRSQRAQYEVGGA